MKTTIKITALAVITVLALLACTPEVELTQRDFTEIRDANNPKYDNVVTQNQAPTYISNLRYDTSTTSDESYKEMEIYFPQNADILNKDITTAALKQFLSMYTFTNGTSGYTEASVKDADVDFEFVRRVRYGTDTDEVVIRFPTVPSKSFVIKLDATKYTFSNGLKLDSNNNGIAGEATYDDLYNRITPSGATSMTYYTPKIDITFTITAETISPNTEYTLTAQDIKIATLNLVSYTSANYKSEQKAVIESLMSKIKLQKYDAASKTWKDVGTVTSKEDTTEWYLAVNITPADGDIYRTYATGMKNLSTTQDFLGIKQKIRVSGGSQFGNFSSSSYNYNTVISNPVMFYNSNNTQQFQTTSPVTACLVSSDAAGKNVKLEVYFKNIPITINSVTGNHWLKQLDTATFNKNVKLVYSRANPATAIYDLSSYQKPDDLVFIPIKDVKYDSNNRFGETPPPGINRIIITLDPSYQISQSRYRTINLLLAPGFKYDDDLIAFGDFSPAGLTLFINGVNRWKAYGPIITGDGSGGGGEIAPSTPTGVTAYALSSSSIQIGWSSVSEADVYNVYRSTSASGSYYYIDSTYSTYYTDYGLSSNTTYYYKVSAENGAGESSLSSYNYATTHSSGGGGIPNLIPLTSGTWTNGNIGSYDEIYYSFNVTSGTTYYVWWNDSYRGDGTKTADIIVNAYYSDATNIYFSDNDSAWSTPQSFTANSTDTVILVVSPDYGSGTFAITYSTSSTRPN